MNDPTNTLPTPYQSGMLDNLLNIHHVITLYDEVVGMLYEIALFESDDTVTDVICKIAEWLENRSDVIDDEGDRIYESLLKNLSRLEQEGE